MFGIILRDIFRTEKGGLKNRLAEGIGMESGS